MGLQTWLRTVERQGEQLNSEMHPYLVVRPEGNGTGAVGMEKNND